MCVKKGITIINHHAYAQDVRGPKAERGIWRRKERKATKDTPQRRVEIDERGGKTKVGSYRINEGSRDYSEIVILSLEGAAPLRAFSSVSAYSSSNHSNSDPSCKYILLEAILGTMNRVSSL